MEANPTSAFTRIAGARESNVERAQYNLLSTGFTTPVPLHPRPSCLQQETFPFTRDVHQIRSHAFSQTEGTWEQNYETVTKSGMNQFHDFGRGESLSCSQNGQMRLLAHHTGSHLLSSSLPFQQPPSRAVNIDCFAESDEMGFCRGPPNQNPFSASSFQKKLSRVAYDSSSCYPVAPQSPANLTSPHIVHRHIPHGAVTNSQQYGSWQDCYRAQTYVPGANAASYNVYWPPMAPVVDSYSRLNPNPDTRQNFTTSGGLSNLPMQHVPGDGVNSVMQNVPGDGVNSVMQKFLGDGVNSVMQNVPDERMSSVMQHVPEERMSSVMQNVPGDRMSSVMQNVPEDRMSSGMQHVPEDRMSSVMQNVPGDRMSSVMQNVPGDRMSSVVQQVQLRDCAFSESPSARAYHYQFFKDHAQCFYSGNPESAYPSSSPSLSSPSFHDANVVSITDNATINPFSSSDIVSIRAPSVAPSDVTSTQPATSSNNPTAQTSHPTRQSTTNDSPSSSSAVPAKPLRRRRRALRVTASSSSSDTCLSAATELPPFCEEYVTKHGCLYPGTTNAPATASSTYDGAALAAGGCPRVYLSNYRLWRRFHAKQTEMLLNKQGRAMYPVLEYHVTGLQDKRLYACVVDMVPVNGEQILTYHSNNWTPRSVGSAACRRHYQQHKEQPPPCSVQLPSLDKENFLVEDRKVLGLHITDCVYNRLYVHPKSPASGDYWMGHMISFSKLKITNSCNDSKDHIVLKSQVKYQARFHILEMKPDGVGVERSVVSAVFPETQFITVTSYQNPEVSDLKILLNPFARSIKKTLGMQMEDSGAALETNGQESKVSTTWLPHPREDNLFQPGCNVVYRQPAAITTRAPCTPVMCADNGSRTTWHAPSVARQLPDNGPAHASQLGMPEQTGAVQQQSGDGTSCAGLGGGVAHAAHVQRDFFSPHSFSHNDSNDNDHQRDGHQRHDNQLLFPQQLCQTYQHQPCQTYQHHHQETTVLQARLRGQQTGLVPMKRARHPEDNTLTYPDCYPAGSKFQKTSLSSPESCVASSLNLML